MRIPVLDHVALHVADRDATAEELCRRFDVSVIERTERFTLIGASEDSGKITLLDADPQDSRAPQPNRIVSLVLSEASGRGTPPPVELDDGLVVTFASVDELSEEWSDVPRHALIGVSLRASDPPLAAAALEAIHGLHVVTIGREHAVLDVGPGGSDGRLTLSRERWDDSAPSMLDHIGIRVDDAKAWRDRFEAADADVVKWVEAPHSLAVFVAGPDGLLLEFVEQTRSFTA